MIYTARRRELGFDVYELDEPVLFSPLLSLHSDSSIISVALLLPVN